MLGHTTGVGSSSKRPDQLETRLRERLNTLGPAPRAELLHVLMLPDFDRADAIGSYWGNPKTSRNPACATSSASLF